MIVNLTSKNVALLSVGFLFTGVLSLTMFSPFDNPAIIPLVIFQFALVLFLATWALSNSLSWKISLHTLISFYGLLAIFVALFSLHQLRFGDIALITGLYFLLRLYSKR